MPFSRPSSVFKSFSEYLDPLTPPSLPPRPMLSLNVDRNPTLRLEDEPLAEDVDGVSAGTGAEGDGGGFDRLSYNVATLNA